MPKKSDKQATSSGNPTFSSRVTDLLTKLATNPLNLNLMEKIDQLFEEFESNETVLSFVPDMVNLISEFQGQADDQRLQPSYEQRTMYFKILKVCLSRLRQHCTIDEMQHTLLYVSMLSNMRSCVIKKCQALLKNDVLTDRLPFTEAEVNDYFKKTLDRLKAAPSLLSPISPTELAQIETKAYQDMLEIQQKIDFVYRMRPDLHVRLETEIWSRKGVIANICRVLDTSGHITFTPIQYTYATKCLLDRGTPNIEHLFTIFDKLKASGFFKNNAPQLVYPYFIDFSKCLCIGDRNLGGIHSPDFQKALDAFEHLLTAIEKFPESKEKQETKRILIQRRVFMITRMPIHSNTIQLLRRYFDPIYEDSIGNLDVIFEKIDQDDNTKLDDCRYFFDFYCQKIMSPRRMEEKEQELYELLKSRIFNRILKKLLFFAEKKQLTFSLFQDYLNKIYGNITLDLNHINSVLSILPWLSELTLQNLLDLYHQTNRYIVDLNVQGTENDKALTEVTETEKNLLSQAKASMLNYCFQAINKMDPENIEINSLVALYNEAKAHQLDTPFVRNTLVHHRKMLPSSVTQQLSEECFAYDKIEAIQADLKQLKNQSTSGDIHALLTAIEGYSEWLLTDRLYHKSPNEKLRELEAIYANIPLIQSLERTEAQVRDMKLHLVKIGKCKHVCNKITQALKSPDDFKLTSLQTEIDFYEINKIIATYEEQIEEHQQKEVRNNIESLLKNQEWKQIENVLPILERYNMAHINDYPAHIAMIRSLVRLSYFDIALKKIEDIRETFGKKTTTLEVEWASCHVGLGDFDRAIQSLKALLEDDALNQFEKLKVAEKLIFAYVLTKNSVYYDQATALYEKLKQEKIINNMVLSKHIKILIIRLYSNSHQFDQAELVLKSINGWEKDPKMQLMLAFITVKKDGLKKLSEVVDFDQLDYYDLLRALNYYYLNSINDKHNIDKNNIAIIKNKLLNFNIEQADYYSLKERVTTLIYDKAYNNALKVLELMSNRFGCSIFVRVSMAVCYQKSGKIPEAIQLLESSPHQNGVIILRLATCHIDLGDHEQAQHYFDVLMQDYKTFPAYYVPTIDYYITIGDEEKITQCYSQCVESCNENIALITAVEKRIEKKGNPNLIKILRRRANKDGVNSVLDQNSEYISLRLELGMEADPRDMTDIDESMENVEDMTELKHNDSLQTKNSVENYVEQGLDYYSEESYSKALIAFNNALKLVNYELALKPSLEVAISKLIQHLLNRDEPTLQESLTPKDRKDCLDAVARIKSRWSNSKHENKFRLFESKPKPVHNDVAEALAPAITDLR